MRHRINRLRAGHEIVIGQPVAKKLAFVLGTAALLAAAIGALVQGIVGGGVDSTGAVDSTASRVMLIVIGAVGTVLFGLGGVLYGIRLVKERGRLVLTREGLVEQRLMDGRWQLYRASPWSEIRTIRLEGVLEKNRLSTVTLYGMFGRWEISARYSWWKLGMLRLLRQCQREFGFDALGQPRR